jgi:transcriptional regulator with XRE-family HTH domain
MSSVGVTAPIIRNTEHLVNRYSEHNQMDYLSMTEIPHFDSFGARLDWWITHRGFKQADVAAKVGMAKSTLSEVCKGESKHPSAQNFLRIAKLLGLRPEYLMWGEGPPEATHMHELSGLEAQLVMLFRFLPDDAKRHALLIDANDFHNRHSGKQGASVANPWAHVAPPPTIAPAPKPVGKAKGKGRADVNH